MFYLKAEHYNNECNSLKSLVSYCCGIVLFIERSTCIYELIYTYLYWEKYLIISSKLLIY